MLVFLPVPAFAHEIYLKAAAPFVADDMVIGVMVAQGGADWCARACIGDKLPRTTFFALETLPWACRIEEFAKVLVSCSLPSPPLATFSPRCRLPFLCVSFLSPSLSLPPPAAASRLSWTPSPICVSARSLACLCAGPLSADCSFFAGAGCSDPWVQEDGRHGREPRGELRRDSNLVEPAVRNAGEGRVNAPSMDMPPRWICCTFWS